MNEQERCQPSQTNPSSTAFGICSFDSNAMKSSNPHSGIYEADTSRTLDLNGGSPACNQGGVAIVEGDGKCLNGWDVQSKRVFSTDGVCGTLNSGTTEGKNIVPSVCLNSWDVQSKHIQPPDGIAEALYSGECRYGGGESYVLDDAKTIALEGNGQRGSHQGDGYSETDTMYTLNTIERHGVYAFAQNQREEVRDLEGKATALSAESGTHQQAYVAAYGVTSKGNGEAFISEERHESLSVGGGQAGQGYPCVLEQDVLPFDTTQVTSPQNGNNPHYGDPCHPLASGAHAPAVAIGADVYNGSITGDVAATIGANTGQSANHAGPTVLAAGFKAGQSKDGGLGYEEEKAPTLSANPSALEPTVLAAGFSFGQSAKARSIGYEEEVSPTLRGGEGGNQKPCVFDARGNGDGQTVPTMTGDHMNRITDYTAVVMEDDQGGAK